MTTATSHTGARLLGGLLRRHRLVAALLTVLACLMAVLAVLPDGVAEPVQAVICWVIVGITAVAAVIVIAKGLERFLDSEAG